MRAVARARRRIVRVRFRLVEQDFALALGKRKRADPLLELRPPARVIPHPLIRRAVALVPVALVARGDNVVVHIRSSAGPRKNVVRVHTRRVRDGCPAVHAGVVRFPEVFTPLLVLHPTLCHADIRILVLERIVFPLSGSEVHPFALQSERRVTGRTVKCGVVLSLWCFQHPYRPPDFEGRLQVNREFLIAFLAIVSGPRAFTGVRGVRPGELDADERWDTIEARGAVGIKQDFFEPADDSFLVGFPAGVPGEALGGTIPPSEFQLDVPLCGAVYFADITGVSVAPKSAL